MTLFFKTNGDSKMIGLILKVENLKIIQDQIRILMIRCLIINGDKKVITSMIPKSLMVLGNKVSIKVAVKTLVMLEILTGWRTLHLTRKDITKIIMTIQQFQKTRRILRKEI